MILTNNECKIMNDNKNAMSYDTTYDFKYSLKKTSCLQFNDCLYYVESLFTLS